MLLQVDDAVATDRLLGRALEEGRADDAPEAIAKRLALYHEMTEPVADYYREAGSLETVDGERTPADVEARYRTCSTASPGPDDHPQGP